jgi:hypothetical protein
MLSLKDDKNIAEKYFSDIKSKITNYIAYVIAHNEIEINNSTIPLSATILDLIKEFTEESFLRSLILVDPKELPDWVRDLRAFRPACIDKNTIEFKVLYRIFVNHGYDKIDKWKLLANHSLDSCTYCNRSYTYALDEEGKIKPEIDHFYSKGIYPLFAASYYNLIPSCETCNGFGAKGTSDTFETGIKNPYLIEENDFEFDYHLQHLSLLNPITAKTTVEVNIKTKINSHFKVFKLDKLYQRHSDHVAELIVKSRIQYSPRYRDYLKSYTGLRFSDNEIDRLIIGSYTNVEDLHKRPLSKMYRDIGVKLGLI